jgi:FkbM family methyltransferase
MLIPFTDLAQRHAIAVERVIHAGAHLGEEAPAYRAVGANEVLWIEGNPDLIKRVTENVAPYGHTVVQALLGAESGNEVTFHVTNFDSMSSSILEFGTHSSAHSEVVVVGDQRHVLRTLDEVAEANGFIEADFLNLDLQGYELEALRGAERLLQHIRTIYTEVNVDEVYKDCVLLPELDAWLNARGFEAAEVQLYGCARRDCSDGGQPDAGGQRFFGWGDCCYLRVETPRPFASIHPKDAADWFLPTSWESGT